MAITTIKSNQLDIGTFTPWTAWVPTFTGFSADPPGIFRYCQIGKMVFCAVRMTSNGTSNATTFTMSAPLTSATITNMIWYNALGIAYDDGILQTTGVHLANIGSNSSTISILRNANTSGWTASGGKRALFQLYYEVA